MPDHRSSLQSDSPLAGAQNSVDKAENAVKQAQSHPSAQMIDQANNTLDTATRAVEQADDSDNQAAYQEACNQLQEAQQQLSDVANDQS